jgi:Na+/H+ antiporter NhaD/arsenite permease-like protein
MEEKMTTSLSIIFVLGYLAIALEHPLRLHKTVSALFTATLCWAVYALYGPERHLVPEQLMEHFTGAAAIAVFLIGAMTIVEIIDAHGGFSIVTDRIGTRNLGKMLWIIGWITFFLSAVLDNLTTTIVMVSLIRKLLTKHTDRLFFAGIIVIAANAGGAWSPIGDVTTTMLWIGGQISALKVVEEVFLASVANLLIPLIAVSIWMGREARGKMGNISERKEGGDDSRTTPAATNHAASPVSHFEQRLIFCVGVGALMFVPVFKTITHLPPWMGILFGLSTLWGVTEILHRKKAEAHSGQLGVTQALRRIDISSVLFFLGILLAVGSLQAIGLLATLAGWLDNEVGNMTIIVMLIGLLSAIVDNVPLVAASMGMYPLNVYPMDHFIWQFMAFCAGTGGSILVIGSAAGVAAMGMEKITFGWYLKKIAPLALAGYLAGAGVYLLQRLILS